MKYFSTVFLTKVSIFIVCVCISPLPLYYFFFSANKAPNTRCSTSALLENFPPITGENSKAFLVFFRRASFKNIYNQSMENLQLAPRVQKSLTDSGI